MNKESGLTLIEVLIASLVLFTAISVAAVSYQTSLYNIEKSHFHQGVSAYRHYIEAQIKQELKDSPRKDKGSFEYGELSVEYEVIGFLNKKFNTTKSMQFNNFSNMEVGIFNIEVKLSQKRSKNIYNKTLLVSLDN